VDSSQLGNRVRAARQAAGISVRELARRVGVSASLISQLENARTQASVGTLQALASELGITMEYLFAAAEADDPSTGTDALRRHDILAEHFLPGGPAGPVILRQGGRRSLEMETGVVWEQLSTLMPGLVDAILATYPPGGSSSSSGRLMRHNGAEYGYLVEGTLTLSLGFDQYELSAGDSFSFDSTEPHLYVNNGDTPAKGVWVVVGRRLVESTDAEPATTVRPGAPPTVRHRDVLSVLDAFDDHPGGRRIG
jgi:transcriptional regulator with XRE-family HTH domain